MGLSARNTHSVSTRRGSSPGDETPRHSVTVRTDPRTIPGSKRVSYPSQPSYTPPYGQPQPPSRSGNLWLGGAAIIIVLIVIMTVTLLIIQRSSGGSTTGDGGTEEPADTAESPAEDTTSPTEDDDGDDDDEGDDDGGPEQAGFYEDTCSDFDLSLLEELYDAQIDPGETHTSASSSGDTGTLICNFYTENFDSASVSVSAVGGADYAVDWLEGDREYWGAEDDYEITDFTEVGDDGYHTVFGDEGYQKRAVTVIAGALYVDTSLWIYPDEHDPSDADEYLRDVCEQALAMFADYM